MGRTALIVAVGTAAVVGAGAVTAAASPASVTAGRPVGNAVLTAAGSANSAKAGADHLRHLLRRVEHGSVVTSGPQGTVVHDAIRGVVTAVSPKSLTVRAADSFSQTFVLSSTTTRVRVRPPQTGGTTPASRGKLGSLADIHRGAEVFALGKASDTAGAVPTAQIVVVGVKR
jgi:hypothetical protein